MTRPLAILRPAPGDRATLERVHAAGLAARATPLFTVGPLAWTPPDPAAFDALVLTSANAVRHGGPGLAMLAQLPVLAVGPQTAAVAAAAGLTVAATGDSDLAALLAGQPPQQRLLWLAGQDRTASTHPALRQVIPVYASTPRPLTAAEAESLHGSVALLHSARAAQRLGTELDHHRVPRGTVRIAGLSAAVADAAGPGWADRAIAARPDDTALIAAARRLAIDP